MTNDLRYVLRSILRRPVFSATFVLTLALGLGLGAAIFSFADGYLFRPLPFPSPEQLYRVRDPHAKIAMREIDTIALRQTAVGEYGFVEWSAGSRIVGDAIIVAGRRVPVRSYDVSARFAEIVGLPVLGRTFGPPDHREGTTVPVWMSHRFWQREFGGDPAVLGRSFTVDAAEPMTVEIVGILGAGVASFDLNNAPPDLVAPAALRGGPKAARTNRLSFPIVRLPDGMAREEGEARISAALQAVAPASDGRVRAVQLRPLRDYQVAGGAPTARLLLAAPLLILLLLTMNLVHLMLAQGIARAREIATRAALGATNGRVLRLFLIEAIVLSLLGTAGGLLSGAWMSQVIASRVPQYPTAGRNLALVPMTFDIRVVAFVVVVGLLVAVVSGLTPAWRALRRPLKTVNHATTANIRRVSRSILASQLTVTTILLLGTVFVGIGIWRYLNPPLGYEHVNRMVIRVEPKRTEQPPTGTEWTAIRAAIGAIPGVRSAGAYRLGQGTPIEVGGEARPTLVAYGVSEGFFESWEVRLSAGRWFTREDYRTEAPVAIVDAAFARRLWPDGSAVGQGFRVENGVLHQIVGIVETQVRSLRKNPNGEAYIPKRVPAEWLPFVAWAPGMSAAELERRVIPVVGSIISGASSRAEPVTKTWLFNRETGEAEFQGPLMAALAFFTFILAAVGIFGRFLTSWRSARASSVSGLQLAPAAVTSGPP
jgi:predicted permease